MHAATLWIRESGSRTVNETTTVSIRDTEGTLVAKAHSLNSAKEAIARANLIVQAVNAHKRLTRHLERLANAVDRYVMEQPQALRNTVDEARAMLAELGGKE